MKKLLLLLLCAPAMADNSSVNLNLPNSGRSYQSDRIRAGDLDCSMAIGSATNVEFGVVGIMNQNGPYDNLYGVGDPSYDPDGLVKDIGVYAKITIPIGAPKERLNCDLLYKMELEKKELELVKLRAELEQIKSLKFEN